MAKHWHIDRGLRWRPKIKSFVNGGYPYNPVLDMDSQKTWLEAAAEYTVEIADTIKNPAGFRRPLSSLITVRSRLYRIRAEERRRILKHG